MGENPAEGGHYITVWAPRQTGKTWLMQQILFRLKQNPRFDVIKINLENLKDEPDVRLIINTITEEIAEGLNKDFTGIKSQVQFQKIFKKNILDKPLILILDEFDALLEKAINAIVSAFRNIYIKRLDESDKAMEQRTYFLHSVALIGVRSVLGIESDEGSPFNVQRSLHVPNLTYEEVKGIFKWYEKESSQEIEQAVVEKLYNETRGQPGLTCWLGELLTEGFEGYTVDKTRSINITDFEKVYRAAITRLPNNNILNIISKANKKPYNEEVFKLFKTNKLIQFRYDNKKINYLYMNGVIEPEISEEDNDSYVKFASPFVQKRLFNYFSDEIFQEMGQLVEAFTNLEHVITPTRLDIRQLMKLYQAYLGKNKSWLFKEVPRRSDLRVYEAVFHFNLFAYLNEFLRDRRGRVLPEFPTGNGKIDLLIQYMDKTYGIELKSFSDRAGYLLALTQAAQYGNQLRLPEIFLVTFVETIDEKTRNSYETDYHDPQTNVTVKPILIQTGAI
jgi:hypothetical protein